MATKIGDDKHVQGRREGFVYVLPDGRVVRSEQLLQEFHPKGVEVVNRARNWKELGLPRAPGWAKELSEAVHISGAKKGMAFVRQGVRSSTRVWTDEGELLAQYPGGSVKPT